MSPEDQESRFRERRSAHIEDDAPPAEPGAATPPAETAEAQPADFSTPVPETPAPAAADEPPATEPAAPEPAAPEPALEAPAGVDLADESLDLEEMARVEIPDPSFYEIVQPLEIQALQFLGELPLTAEGHRRVLPRWAKHVIDLLGLLEQRTQGNLTPEESQYLEQVLADLRMRYLRIAS